MNDFNPPAPPAPPVNASEQVNLPAIGLMVAGGLGLLSQILLLLIHFGLMGLSLPFAGGSSMGLSMLTGSIILVLRVMGIGVNLFILYGAMQMKGLKNHTMAIAGAIAAVIPCFSQCPCCFIGIAAGIWAIIVLIKPDVKAAFAQK